jgi:hypothetical protein
MKEVQTMPSVCKKKKGEKAVRRKSGGVGARATAKPLQEGVEVVEKEVGGEERESR